MGSFRLKHLFPFIKKTKSFNLITVTTICTIYKLQRDDRFMFLEFNLHFFPVFFITVLIQIKPKNHEGIVDSGVHMLLIGLNTDEYEDVVDEKSQINYDIHFVEDYDEFINFAEELGGTEKLKGINLSELDIDLTGEQDIIAKLFYTMLKTVYKNFLINQNLDPYKCKIYLRYDHKVEDLKFSEDDVISAVEMNHVTIDRNKCGECYNYDIKEEVFDFIDSDEAVRIENQSVKKFYIIRYIEIAKLENDSNPACYTFLVRIPYLEVLKSCREKIIELFNFDNNISTLEGSDDLELDCNQKDTKASSSNSGSINDVTLYFIKKSGKKINIKENCIKEPSVDDIIAFLTNSDNVKKNVVFPKNKDDKIDVVSHVTNFLCKKEDHLNSKDNVNEQIPVTIINTSGSQSALLDEIFDVVKSEESASFLKLFKLMKKFLKNENWNYSALSKNGHTLLHDIVIYKKDYFFFAVFFLGGWNILNKMKLKSVEQSFPFNNMTPEEICTSFKNRKLMKSFDSFSLWDKSLNFLHVQARLGNLNEIIRLRNYSDNLHLEYDGKNCSCLFWAVVSGCEELVKYFLEVDPFLQYMNSPPNFIFTVAGWLGHHHLFTILSKALNPDIKAPDMFKKTVLTRIAENSDLDSLKKLLHLKLITVNDMERVVPIAGSNGDLQFLKNLLKQYELNPNFKDENGRTAFMRAVAKNNLEIITYLAELNINLRETTHLRKNVFHIACEQSKLQTLEFLYDLCTRTLGDEETSKLLNSKDFFNGLDLCILIRGRDRGKETWHYVEVERLLHKIFMESSKKSTPINIAKYGNTILSGWGVNPSEEFASEIDRRYKTAREFSKHDIDQTPLHIATFKERYDICKFLLEKKVSVNARDKQGSTPLHIAAMTGNLPLIKLLLDHHAETKVLNVYNKTPSDTACDNENKEAYQLLTSVEMKSRIMNIKLSLENKISNTLSPEAIDQVESRGEDLKDHLIDTLRNLAQSISQHLCDIGSGPIQQSSE